VRENKKATGRECPWPPYTACILSGNRRTPRRYDLTAGIGGADTGYNDKSAVNHEVRLLSLGFSNKRSLSRRVESGQGILKKKIGHLVRGNLYPKSTFA
jgi:hypothetical protein